MPGLSLDGACSVLRASDPSPLRLPEAFESCFDAIGEEGMMGRLPRSVDEVPTDLAGPGHEAALRKRLQRLGYLSAFHADRGVFDAAIRKFQEEAGLVVDGWTGARTWEALQELFTFENPFNAARWFGGDGKLLPALRRALRLRLTAYGQWNGPADESLPTLPNAFECWLRNARRIGYEAAEADDSEVTVDRVARLFDHDAIIEHLTAQSARCDPQTYGSEADEVRHLLLCFAKVELWLNGYPVAPDGKTTLSTQKTVFVGRGGRRRRTRQRRVSDSDFFDVVESFLKDTQGDGINVLRTVRRLPRNDDARLDHAIAAILLRTRDLRADGKGKERATLSDDELAAMVLREEQPKKFWRKLTDTVKTLATSLFDGVRRVWRWLRDRIGRVVKWAEEALINLARAVWHRLTEIGRLVRAGISAFVTGVSYFLRPTLAFSDQASLVVAHGLDFDFKVFVNRLSEDAVVQAKTDELKRLAMAWKIACKIIGLVTTAARAALRGTSGFGLLFVASSLIQMGSQLQSLGEHLSAYISLDDAEPLEA